MVGRRATRGKKECSARGKSPLGDIMSIVIYVAFSR